MEKIFFTSDLHFGHENVIRFDNRPFKTVEEIDSELIRRWNAKVAPGDLVYVLGDLIWKTRNDDAPDLNLMFTIIDKYDVNVYNNEH